jgi:hypothetical protein
VDAGAMEIVLCLMSSRMRATAPAGAAGSVAGAAAWDIASPAACAGAAPAKLGVATEPPAVEASAVTPLIEELDDVVVLAAFAEAAALRASLLALCAETASQRPTAITKGMRKPAKTAKTFQPLPLPSS